MCLSVIHLGENGVCGVTLGFISTLDRPNS